MKSARLVILLALAAVGCHKSPVERTQDTANPTALGRFGVAPFFAIFNNELVSGGGAFEYPGGDNQDLAFNDRSNPLSQRSIRYHWNGQPAIASSNGSFAGFTLMHVPLREQYDTTVGRNLTQAGYSKVTFFARGSLSTNTVVKIEVADDAGGPVVPPCLTLSTDGSQNSCGATAEAPQRLTGNWQQYTIHLPSASYLANIKDFLKATFVYNFPLGVPGEAPGQGGTIYLDDIKYEP